MPVSGRTIGPSDYRTFGLSIHNRSRPKAATLHDSGLLLQVLNDVVVDHGTTSFLCSLDVYIGTHLVTTVQGDGLYFNVNQCQSNIYIAPIIEGRI